MTYEHHRSDQHSESVDQPQGIPDRSGVVDRPERRGDVRGDAGIDAEPETAADGGSLLGYEQGPVSPEVAQIAALVVAQISQHQHIHLAQTPDPDQLAELRVKVPEVYELWIETTRKRNEHELWQSKKATRQPYLLASLGQWLGLVAVLGVLVVAGIAVYLDHAWVGAVLGVIDVIGLAAVFNGNQARRRPKDG